MVMLILVGLMLCSVTVGVAVTAVVSSSSLTGCSLESVASVGSATIVMSSTCDGRWFSCVLVAMSSVVSPVRHVSFVRSLMTGVAEFGCSVLLVSVDSCPSLPVSTVASSSCECIVSHR